MKLIYFPEHRTRKILNLFKKKHATSCVTPVHKKTCNKKILIPTLFSTDVNRSHQFNSSTMASAAIKTGRTSPFAMKHLSVEFEPFLLQHTSIISIQWIDNLAYGLGPLWRPRCQLSCPWALFPHIRIDKFVNKT